MDVVGYLVEDNILECQFMFILPMLQPRTLDFPNADRML